MQIKVAGLVPSSSAAYHRPGRLLVPYPRRGFLLLLDSPLEEAATLCLVDDLDVGVDGRVGAVGRLAVVVESAAAEVDVGGPSHYLDGRVAVLVGEPRPEAVDARRFGLAPRGVILADGGRVLTRAVAVAVRGRDHVVRVGGGGVDRRGHVAAGPVELAVVGVVALALAEVGEELSKVVVVRGLEEVEPPDVAEVGGHLLGIVFAEDLDGGGALRVPDLLVSLLEVVSLQPLPG